MFVTMLEGLCTVVKYIEEDVGCSLKVNGFGLLEGGFVRWEGLNFCALVFTFANVDFGWSC